MAKKTARQMAAGKSFGKGAAKNALRGTGGLNRKLAGVGGA